MNKEFYINVLADLSEAIKATGSQIFIFGGFTIDIWQKGILRDHHDVDTICIDFWSTSGPIASFFGNKGYEIVTVPNGDLKIKKSGFGISMTNCQIDGRIAKWCPYGVTGDICFPAEWLDLQPQSFQNFELYTVDRRFEYCLKNNPQGFNADWPVRDHSKTLSYLKEHLDKESISVDSFIDKMYRE